MGEIIAFGHLAKICGLGFSVPTILVRCGSYGDLRQEGIRVVAPSEVDVPPPTSVESCYTKQALSDWLLDVETLESLLGPCVNSRDFPGCQAATTKDSSDGKSDYSNVEL
jgi:hypothetical protein